VFDEVWQLRRGDEVLGEITITEVDFPWLHGSFAARPEFAEFAPLFAEELKLTEALEDSDADDLNEAWEAAYHRINVMLTLVGPAGPAAEFLLHIDAGEAWFRWTDEPFDES
jgi:hypothetical protein